MRRITILALSTAAIGLAAAGGAQAADGKPPGFNEMDKDSDGSLTRSEAAANPALARHFDKVDRNGDGQLTRGEYLSIMARQDLFFLRENLAEALEPEAKPPVARQDASQQASAGASGGEVPGFTEMDKDGDGNLTRAEAAGNPRLAESFAKVDSDGDGQVSRSEYLAVAGRRDLQSLRQNLAEFIKPEGQPPLAAGSQPASAKARASAGASAPGQNASVPPPVSRQLVRNVQESLKAEGIDAGPVDGLWGPRTSAGVRKFQEDQGIQASGQLNAETISALGIGQDESPQSSQGGSQAR